MAATRCVKHHPWGGCWGGVTEMQISLGGALQDPLESPVWGVVSCCKERGGERRRWGTGRQLSPLVAALRPPHNLCVSQEHRCQGSRARLGRHPQEISSQDTSKKFVPFQSLSLLIRKCE